ncbi:MAG: cysteine hydrolase, partial [Chloroflexi bacterium]|nr:cysteine hydrolase [Chloroflexota bacterium]
ADTVRHGGAFGYDMVVVPDACGYPTAAPQLATLQKRAAFASTDRVIQAVNMATASRQRSAKPALIVVDMQNDYVHPAGAQYAHGHNAHLDAEAMFRLIRNNERLLQATRGAGHPVIYVVTERRHDPLDNGSPPAALKSPPVPSGTDYLVIGTWGAEVLEEIKPLPEDFIERKKGRSGFSMTPLHRLLRNLEVTECVVSGGALHGCLEDTVRVGAALGYAFTIVTDAIYPGPPSDASRQVLGTHASFKTTDEVLALLTCG